MGLNVIGLMAFPMPAQPFGWFKEPISGVEDINGMKYRTVGLAADLLQSMGMSVAQLPGGEIVPAMERGVIDAFEWAEQPTTSDLRFGAQDGQAAIISARGVTTAEAFEFLFNRDVMEDTETYLRAILEHGVEAVSTYNCRLRARQLFGRPAEAARRVRCDHPQDPRGDLAGAAAWSEMMRTRAARCSRRLEQPARLGEAHRLLRADGRPDYALAVLVPR